jgi:hypothetical protein
VFANIFGTLPEHFALLLPIVPKGIPFGTAIIHIKRRPKRVPESFGTLLGRLTSTFNILERRLRAY